MLRAFFDAWSPSRFAALARPGTLLAFDYDGTLAPLVAEPAAARMRCRTQILLREVGTRYPVVIISGRARNDVGARLGDTVPLAVIGNHGAEDGETPLAGAVALMRAIIAHLTASRAIEGLFLEDKGASIALHWPPNVPDALGASLTDRVANLLRMGDSPVRLVPGHRVLNVVPKGFANKGDALFRIATAQGARRVLFVGDDVTDEDAFALPRPRFVSVRIGFAVSTNARYYLPDQLAIDHLLLELVRRRPPAST